MSYENRLNRCKLEKLQNRWERQFKVFAEKTVKSGRLTEYIKPSLNTHEMCLRKPNVFHHPICRTERYRRSTINAIIRSVNEGDSFEIVYED